MVVLDVVILDVRKISQGKVLDFDQKLYEIYFNQISLDIILTLLMQKEIV